MDIQTRKIEFIQDFLKVKSEDLISRLEAILRKEDYSSNPDEFKPMTVEEFNNRIDKSMEDSENGRLISAGDLKSKIEEWN
ncbi:hypothetical protein JL193_02080 [Polaribacter batillariae]|uniref:Addiction module component n=1 Tax=Polaribacter batillariae TaxID=2808900 RepID=A0ABX7SV52_9FLAO|nr:hypothetical protein [Polaribacter batillariae]QTD38117.1 hypothetical protein JL193_02080 [Polaribacter batillariae]